MSIFDVVRDFLFWLGIAIATGALLAIGVTAALAIDHILAAHRSRRKMQARWLGDTQTVEVINRAERDALERLFALPAREPRR